MNYKNTSFNSDKIGMISSFLCLVHCLTVPVLLSFQPVLAEFITEDLFYLEYIFLALSFVAVYYSARNASFFIKVSFGIVLTVFSVSLLLEHHLDWMRYLTYLGSLGLIVTHLINYYRCRQCEVIPRRPARTSSQELFFENIYASSEKQNTHSGHFQNFLD
ncbi:MAG: MerC domain-containing protein [Microscillaceae bacterium]|nr:MerC domain-containing protein [Microscillaceae bacterium]